MSEVEVIWKEEPDDHDYPAAEEYLDLVFSPDTVRALVIQLRRGHMHHFKAKDIIRASRLPLLPTDNPHVWENIRKIHQRIPLSPVLLVRGKNGDVLHIADGYHRTCAVYHYGEDARVPCKIA